MTNNAAFDGPDNCPICALGMSQTLRIVSRHRTSTGTVVYARCQCGRLSMWTEPDPVAGSPRRDILAAARASC